MPRIETVKSARKPAGTCVRCGEEVEVGQGYSHVSAFRGPRRVIHSTCGSFKRSETTFNDKLASLYELQDEADDFEWDTLEALDDVPLDDWAARAEEVADSYDESADSMEEGFGHETEQSSQARENADEVRSWSETIRDCLNSQEDKPDDDEDEINDWREAVREAVTEAMGELPL